MLELCSPMRFRLVRGTAGVGGDGTPIMYQYDLHGDRHLLLHDKAREPSTDDTISKEVLHDIARGSSHGKMVCGGAHGHGADSRRERARVQCAQAAQQRHNGGRYYRRGRRASTLTSSRCRWRARRGNCPLWAIHPGGRPVGWSRSRGKPTSASRPSGAIRQRKARDSIETIPSVIDLKRVKVNGWALRLLPRRIWGMQERGSVGSFV